MKGPGHRGKFDVRRLWECPLCQRREKTTGTVVNRRCVCQTGKESPAGVWMRLVEERVRPVLGE